MLINGLLAVHDIDAHQGLVLDLAPPPPAPGPGIPPVPGTPPTPRLRERA